MGTNFYHLNLTLTRYLAIKFHTQSALFRATKLFNLGDFIAKHDFKDISNVTLAYDDEKLAKEPENFFVETGRGLEYCNLGDKSASH